jgi:hypothetical protein
MIGDAFLGCTTIFRSSIPRATDSASEGPPFSRMVTATVGAWVRARWWPGSRRFPRPCSANRGPCASSSQRLYHVWGWYPRSIWVLPHRSSPLCALSGNQFSRSCTPELMNRLNRGMDEGLLYLRENSREVFIIAGNI